MQNLSNLSTTIIELVEDYSCTAIDAMISQRKADADDAKAKDQMLAIMQALVEEAANFETVRDTYRYGMQDCRREAQKAYDEGLLPRSTDRNAAGAAGAAKFNNYSKHLALMSWAITNDSALAKDSVAVGENTPTTMAERAKMIREAFDTEVLMQSKMKAQMVSLAGLEWDLKFVQGLKEDQKALLGFTDSTDTVNREVGATVKKVRHQMELAKLRSKHNSRVQEKWRHDLGVQPVVSDS
jgi:hypothetical protein